MSNFLDPAELDALKKWPTPAVSNAIELLKVRPRNQGFMLPEIKCILPDLGPIIGYAVTAIMTADSADIRRFKLRDWWKKIFEVPEPRIVVIQDLDHSAVDSFWGEVNANIYRTLGCLGAVTNGSVRDLDEVKDMGFHFFASGVAVSHAYARLLDVNIPVKVGGLEVKPGDLLMGDQHGVIAIPLEIARDVPPAAQVLAEWEQRIIDFCKSPKFNLEGLEELMNSPPADWQSY